MAKRYYICDILGDGSSDNPYRPAVADMGVNHVAAFPPNNASGGYDRMTCLVLVNAANLARLNADPRTRPMPEFPLDGKLNAIQTPAVSAMESMLAERGFTKTWANSDGYRSVIRSVGKQLDDNFHEDNFDVSE